MWSLLTILGLLFGGSDNPCERVYRPNRLLLLDPYKKVSGVVKNVNAEWDGDVHIRLDITDKTLLAPNNIKHEGGCLILEIICTKDNVHSICKGYVNHIPIPKIGDSIEVLGPYVFDKVHGFNEIHPIEVLHFLK